MEWELIETAPKDGTEFVTCNMRQGGVKQLVNWDKIHNRWESKGDVIISLQATHWLKLPKNPSKKKDNDCVHSAWCGHK